MVRRSLSPARLIGASAAFSVLLAGCSVPEEALSKQRALALRSTIVGAHGEVLATVYEENRAQAKPEDIPQLLRDAIVAVEDARFYDHGAIDSRALLRALVTNVSEGRAAQGGSTITQQLAKLMFTDPALPRTFKVKLREARQAIALEQKHSKDEILTMYLNRAYFGARAYGVVAAAETYFSKSLEELTLTEAALIAGMVKAPTSLDPFSNPKGARQRRAYVLRRMHQEGMITRQKLHSANLKPVRLKRGVSGLRAMKFPYFVQYIEQEFLRSSAFGKTEAERAEKLYKGGLTIHTTLDEKWQRFAEASVQKALYLDSDPEAALVAIDPRSGQVKAMVGGRNFSVDQFNIAARGQRQPGSAFKPFVLGAALEQEIGTQTRYASWPTTLYYNGEKWPVDNYDGAGHGHVTLRRGMENSINGVYARLIIDVGPDNVVDFAQRAGIRSQLDPYPAIALGGLTYGVSPLEMASAYGTFAMNGKRFPPHGIARVEDSTGKVIFNDKTVKAEQVIDPKVAYTIADVLRGTACQGTAERARFGRPMGGKTGTTQSKKDVWLIGFTPDLATAVWVGHRKPRPMSTLHGVQVFGGTFGAQIWKGFTERALAGSPAVPFTTPGAKPPDKQGECDYGEGPGLIEDSAIRTRSTCVDLGTCVPRSTSPKPSPTPTPTPTKPPPPPPPPPPSPSPTPTATPTKNGPPDPGSDG